MFMNKHVVAIFLSPVISIVQGLAVEQLILAHVLLMHTILKQNKLRRYCHKEGGPNLIMLWMAR
ncbi:hypothetical protein ACJX0J_039481 [Zea mays]